MVMNSETNLRIKQGKIDIETFCQKFGFHICPNKEHEFLPEILRFFMHHTLFGDNLLIHCGVAAVYVK